MLHISEGSKWLARHAAHFRSWLPGPVWEFRCSSPVVSLSRPLRQERATGRRKKLGTRLVNVLLSSNTTLGSNLFQIHYPTSSYLKTEIKNTKIIQTNFKIEPQQS